MRITVGRSLTLVEEEEGGEEAAATAPQQGKEFVSEDFALYFTSPTGEKPKSPSSSAPASPQSALPQHPLQHIEESDEVLEMSTGEMSGGLGSDFSISVNSITGEQEAASRDDEVESPNILMDDEEPTAAPMMKISAAGKLTL